MPIESTPPSHAHQFEALQRKFVEGLRRRLEEIEAAPDTASQHAALHRLAGAAGAFGYEALGQLARTAMLASRDTPHQLASALAALYSAIQALIAQH